MAKKKVWKSSLIAKAGMSVSDDAATMQGSKDNFLIMNQEGSYHGGKHSFICAPSDIRIGGMWVLNDQLVSTLPSTIITPLPVMKLSYPVSGIANISSMVAQMSSLLI